MSGDQHMEEMHYMNMGYPYNVPETFTEFLNGVSQPPIQYHNNPLQIPDQENAYWSMNMSYYKYGHSSLESTSYHSYEAGINHVSRPDLSERPWEYAVPVNVHEGVSTVHQGVSTDVIYEENMVVPEEDAGPEECVLSNQDDSNHQEILEDDIDPDNMTYEELLDLGETVGTESRGLPDELINLLPTTKYKSNGIFSRKKSEERCVICQMRYKRGDRQINFPCKHIYHTECGSKWLSINKTCPICNAEVHLDE
ncbi:putative ATP synthase subunit O, mitochondrial-like [Capsicum annuum]|uniref:E3 ubiquitin-protein ligase BIG BROTHER n=1 Tax=Capsicum annuum TaxID=4072 RepID=UPI0007BEE770|nr:E3 ubiquitin-protein ligase BIG BROTHER [Capsicum annuum]KAF3633509.1 putative ATP synthase subunit O, mitochondrial-like [Capsicum annuum]